MPSSKCLIALKAAERAEAEAAVFRETLEKKRQRIEELEERAKLFGDSVKHPATYTSPKTGGGLANPSRNADPS